MNNKPAYLFLLLAALAPAPTLVAKWISLGNKDKARVEVDAGSVVRADGGKLRVWHRESYTAPRIANSGAFSFSRVSVLNEFQCDKRSVSLLQTRYATANDSEIKAETFDGRDALAIAPDSVQELVFDYACWRMSGPAVKPVPAAAPAPAPVPVPVAAPVAEAKEAVKKTKAGKNDKEETAHEAPHWSYSGDTGADKWGNLDKSFETSGIGQRQSPIDIRRTVLADLPPTQFAYKPVPLSIVNNGHSIRVDTPGAGEITVDGETYELQQFHFHKPSEEKLNGKTYDMVVHLVHQSKAGKLAVVAVMMEAGKEQSLIRTLWTHLPLE